MDVHFHLFNMYNKRAMASVYALLMYENCLLDGDKAYEIRLLSFQMHHCPPKIVTDDVEVM